MEYELMFLIADSKKPEFDRIKTEVKALVEKAGGTWTGDSFEFERKLSYEIKHEWKGTYFVQRFTLPDADERSEGLGEDELPANVIGEITRQINLNKDILRYIIVNAEELPPLSDFVKQMEKEQKTPKTALKEKGEKIDEKLEEALNI
jgi:ribosomal protein S6